MASLARPPLGESSCASQGATNTFGLTGYGVKTPAYEAGPFLPVPPLRAGYDSEQHKYTYFPKAQKKKKLRLPYGALLRRRSYGTCTSYVASSYGCMPAGWLAASG